jgi:hypothetical protein
LCGLVVVVAAAAASVLHHAFGLLEEIHCCWFEICNSSFRMCIRCRENV